MKEKQEIEQEKQLNSSTEEEAKTGFNLDVKKILETKIPSLKGKLPWFVYSYLRHVIHEEEVNYVMNTYGHLRGMDFAKALLYKHLNVTFSVYGEENLPKNSDVVFACNHPIGSVDGVTLILALGEYYPTLKIPVNDILLNIKSLDDFFIPVNKVKGGGQQRMMSSQLTEAFEKGDPVLFFPSGECSRKQSDGKVCDNAWKKTFISKAKEYRRSVVPIYFDGRNSNFFLNLSYYRKKLGIRANIEMLYLSDEMFNKKNKKFTVTIGEPIPYTTFDGSKTDLQWAEEVKQVVYNMANAAKK